MARFCMLAADLNNCQYYNNECGTCNDGPEICGFKEKNEIGKQKEYQRKPKWFDQYLRCKGRA